MVRMRLNMHGQRPWFACNMHATWIREHTMDSNNGSHATRSMEQRAYHRQLTWCVRMQHTMDSKPRFACNAYATCNREHTTGRAALKEVLEM